MFSYFKPVCLALVLSLTALSPVSAQSEKQPEKPKKEEAQHEPILGKTHEFLTKQQTKEDEPEKKTNKKKKKIKM